MNDRPVSVTIIGVLLIFAGAAALLFYWSSTPLLRDYVQIVAGAFDGETMILAGLLITIACGAGMLLGSNGSRLVYIGWNAVGLVDGLMAAPPRFSAPAWAAFAVVAFFLLCEPANAWFRRGATARA